MVIRTKTINGLSLCSGIGGIELGLKLVLGDSYCTICYVEKEIYCVEVLASRMEENYIDMAPIWDNIKTFNCKPWCGKVDIISGGYPCQPFSKANNYKRGEQDPRHLWPNIKEIVDEVRPTLCFFENVRNHLNQGGETVYTDLQRMGYTVKGGIFSASEIGASHLRERFFTLSYLDSRVLQFKRWWTSRQKGKSKIQSTKDVSNFLGWRTQPTVGRVADGVSYRLDRIRALGNAVVPIVAAKAFYTLLSSVK